MAIDTTLTERIIPYYSGLSEFAASRVILTKSVQEDGRTIKEVNREISEKVFQYGVAAPFTDENLKLIQSEIRNNVLGITEETQLKQYLYYLVKIIWKLRLIAEYNHQKFEEFKNVYGIGADDPDPGYVVNNSSYKDFDELISHCYQMLSSLAFLGLRLFFIVRNEFGIKADKWKEHIVTHREPPSYRDVENLFEQSINTRFRQEVTSETPTADINSRSSDQKKLQWKGTPSQFGFIIDLLIQGGYLEKPTSSYTKDARIYLNIFDISCSENTLIKELSETTNSLSAQNRKKINIPSVDKLD